MIVAPARVDDLEAIVALELDGFTHARWSREAWAAELCGSDRCVLVSRDADQRVVAVATFQFVDDFADLLRVVVASDRRRQGIARRLLAAGMQWAQACGAARMLLEVDETNMPARAAYLDLGFEPIDRRADYYGPGLAAIVMERDLSSMSSAAREGVA